MKKINSPSNMITFAQAKRWFQAGEFQQAYAVYQQLGEKYGAELVRANLYLCEKQRTLGTRKFPELMSIEPNSAKVEANAAVSQLASTQALLEKYYLEAQLFKYQQMDV